MEILCKEGRGSGLLSARRLKSFKCFVIGAVCLNIIIFLSFSWKTAPDSSAKSSSSLAQLGIRNPRHAADDNTLVFRVSDSRGETRAHKNDNKEIVINDGDAEKNQNPLPERVKDQVKKANELNKLPEVIPLTLSGSKLKHDNGVKTACSYRTAVYLNNRHIKLNKSPFADYLAEMTCFEDGNIADFSGKFTKFKNIILDSSKVTNSRKGGEKMEDVWNQRESDEYFDVLPGYFKAPCSQKPRIRFSEVDHLKRWHEALGCYNINETNINSMQLIDSTTLAIQRYEYVNLYHTMCDFYNAFVLMLIYGVHPSKMNILVVDAHPIGSLDSVWETLFGKFIRAGRLSHPTIFPNLAWGLLGYFSPLNNHDSDQVPYLDAFREFFLSHYNVSTKHALDCQHPNVVLIWRRDYVAHPRNPKGSVVRKFDNEEEMIDQVQKVLGEGANVGGLQLDALPMREQLQTISSCDILIGMHGAGMSHILFLPPTSGVIELKPSYSNPALLHFRAFARWRNLPYTIWQNFDVQNERDNHKTYIPLNVIADTVKTIYKKICYNAR